MINLRYFCFVVIQLYLKVRALALFYFINLHHYTYITKIQEEHTSGWANTGYFRCIANYRQNKIHRDSSIHSHPDVSKFGIHRKSKFSSNLDVFQLISREYTRIPSQSIPAQAGKTSKIHRKSSILIHRLNTYTY